jgi:hypothetical protein
MVPSYLGGKSRYPCNLLNKTSEKEPIILIYEHGFKGP